MTRIIQTIKHGIDVYVVIHVNETTTEMLTNTFLGESMARQFAARKYAEYDVNLDVVGRVELLQLKTPSGKEFELEVEHDWLTNRRYISK